MIAYNPLWLNNLFIREKSEAAYYGNCLDKDELDHIYNKYPVKFYSPNLFIRIGLFILTTVIVLFSFGLFALTFLDSIDQAIAGMAIFLGLLSYAALEYIVQKKRHLQSGIDDALLWIFAIALFGGISTLINAGNISNCIIAFLISLYGAIRFGDRLMSVVVYLSSLGICFFVCTRLGPFFKALVPFVFMIISVFIYLLGKWINRPGVNQLYANCLTLLNVSALLGFYFSGNYFVVRELSNALFDLNLSKDAPIPLGWLFWCFTLVIPTFYILRGIQKKDAILIRVGLLLVAVIVFTLRYYYPVTSIEVIMTLAGIVLIVVAWLLTKYLKTPKYGFTNQQIVSAHTKGNLKLESLVQAQTFSGESASQGATEFGGGNFGGGGGSGEF